MSAEQARGSLAALRTPRAFPRLRSPGAPGVPGAARLPRLPRVPSLETGRETRHVPKPKASSSLSWSAFSLSPRVNVIGLRTRGRKNYPAGHPERQHRHPAQTDSRRKRQFTLLSELVCERDTWPARDHLLTGRSHKCFITKALQVLFLYKRLQRGLFPQRCHRRRQTQPLHFGDFLPIKRFSE